MKSLYPPQRARQARDLFSLVRESAELYGDKEYLVYKKKNELQSLSFNALSEKVTAMAEAFLKLGFSATPVAVIGETCPEWIITYLAAVSSGNIIVPLDRELARDEIVGFIRKVGCRAVVYTQKYAPYFDGHGEDFEDGTYFVEIAAELPEDYTAELACPAPGHLNFEDLLAFGQAQLDGGDAAVFELEADLEKTAAILFTSGTTGTAKGVMLAHRCLVAAINSSYNMTNFDEDDVIVSVLPVHHTYEMTCGILTPILIGCTVCINDSLKRVVKNFQLYRPTGLVLVPLFVSTLYKKIWETAKKTGKDKLLRGSIRASSLLRKIKIDPRKLLFKSVQEAFGGRLERIICGGAPMEADFVKEFDDFGVALCQGYGITECAPLIAVCPEKANRAGSVGLPVPGLEVRIDKEEGEDYGEIVVKGPNVMQGYYGDEEATRAVLEEDGWFHTGDFGYQDEDGYLYVTGRKKNVIVLDNGKNVFPEEIEEYLEKIDLVCEVAVVGRKNEEGAVTVTAVIYPDFAVAKEMGLEEDLNAIGVELKQKIAELNRSLPAFKQIRGVELRRTEFDKTTTHKIKRYKLEQ